jgi:hypothetical protein
MPIDEGFIWGVAEDELPAGSTPLPPHQPQQTVDVKTGATPAPEGFDFGVETAAPPIKTPPPPKPKPKPRKRPRQPVATALKGLPTDVQKARGEEDRQRVREVMSRSGMTPKQSFAPKDQGKFNFTNERLVDSDARRERFLTRTAAREKIAAKAAKRAEALKNQPPPTTAQKLTTWLAQGGEQAQNIIQQGIQKLTGFDVRTQQGIEAQEYTAEKLAEEAARIPQTWGNRIVGGTLKAAPTVALATLTGSALGGGTAAMMAGGGTVAAAGADWSDPQKAAVQVAISTIAPYMGGKLAHSLLAPVVAKLPAMVTPATVGVNVAGGMAGAGIASAAHQQSARGYVDSDKLIEDSLIGGVISGVISLPSAREVARRIYRTQEFERAWRNAQDEMMGGPGVGGVGTETPLLPPGPVGAGGPRGTAMPRPPAPTVPSSTGIIPQQPNIPPQRQLLPKPILPIVDWATPGRPSAPSDFSGALESSQVPPRTIQLPSTLTPNIAGQVGGQLPYYNPTAAEGGETIPLYREAYPPLPGEEPDVRYSTEPPQPLSFPLTDAIRESKRYQQELPGMDALTGVDPVTGLPLADIRSTRSKSGGAPNAITIPAAPSALPSPSVNIRDIIRRVRQRDIAKAQRRQFADLAKPEITNSPFYQGLKQMPVEELTQEITDLGGDPSQFKNNADLMARWLTREMGGRMVAGGEGLAPDVAAKKAEFEERLQEQQPPEMILRGALAKLGTTEEGAIALLSLIHEGEVNKGYLSPERQAQVNDAWDKLIDEQGRMRLTKAEIQQLQKLMYDRGFKQGVSGLRSLPAPQDLSAAMNKMAARKTLKAAKLEALAQAPVEEQRRLAEALGVRLSNPIDSMTNAMELLDAAAAQKLKDVRRKSRVSLDQMRGDVGAIPPEPKTSKQELQERMAEVMRDPRSRFGLRSLASGPYQEALVPGTFLPTEPSKAPIMVVPEEMVEVLGGSVSGGFKFSMSELPLAMRMLDNAFKQSAEPYKQMLAELARKAREAGVSSLLLHNASYPDLQDESLYHETFHAGQQAALDEVARREGIDLSEVSNLALLYDKQWVELHPTLAKFRLTPFGQMVMTHKAPEYTEAGISGVELPAYVAGGQYNEINWGMSPANPLYITTAEGLDLVYDQARHIRLTLGPEALQALKAKATLRPNIKELLDLEESMYETEQLFQSKPGVRLERYGPAGPSAAPTTSLSTPASELPTRRGESIGDRAEAAGIDRPGLQRGGGRGDVEAQGGTIAGAVRSLKDLAETAPPPGSGSEWYYSQLETVVREKFPNRLTPEQAAAMFQNKQYGIKAEEYEWSGLDKLIAAKTVKGEKITKQEILDTLAENRVEVGEVLLGDENPRAATIYAEIANLAVRRDQIRIEEDRALRAWQNAPANSPDRPSLERAYNALVTERNAVEVKLDELNDEQLDLQGAPDTRHSNWKALKGGDPGTYRELIFTLPNLDFTDGHFPDIKGNLGWARFNTGKDVEGNDVLVLQEVQSPLHQQGREKGYKTEENRQRYIEAQRQISRLTRKMDERRLSTDEQNELRRWNAELLNTSPSNAVPNAPFKQSWPELIFKRMIRWAAENGFSRIVWTTGKQQIDLYEDTLRQNVDRIEWTADLNGIHLTPVKDNEYTHNSQLYNLTPERLGEIVGPRIAGQIMGSITDHMGSGVVEGPDLSIGGQLHKLLYDEKLPQFARDMAKRLGGGYGRTLVGDTTIIDEIAINDLGRPYAELSPELQRVVQQQADSWRSRNRPPAQEVHYFDIPQHLITDPKGLRFKLFSIKPPTPNQQKAQDIIDDAIRRMAGGAMPALDAAAKAYQDSKVARTQARKKLKDLEAIRNSPEFADPTKSAELENAINAAKADRESTLRASQRAFRTYKQAQLIATQAYRAARAQSAEQRLQDPEASYAVPPGAPATVSEIGVETDAAFVAAARDAMQAYGLTLDPDRHVTPQIIEWALNGQIPLSAMTPALEHAGIDLATFLNRMSASISQDASRMARRAHIRRLANQMAKENPEVAKTLEAVLPTLSEMNKMFRRRSNIDRFLSVWHGMLTGTLQTAMRNLGSTQVMVGLDTLGQLMDSAVQNVGKGTLDIQKPLNPGLAMAPWLNLQTELARTTFTFGARLIGKSGEKPDAKVLPAYRTNLGRIVKVVNAFEQAFPQEVKIPLFEILNSDDETRLLESQQGQPTQNVLQLIERWQKEAKALPDKYKKKPKVIKALSDMKARYMESQSLWTRGFVRAEQVSRAFGIFNRAQETIARRAVFEAKVRRFASEKGYNIDEMIDRGELAQLPVEIVDRAVQEALHATMALRPRQKAPGEQPQPGSLERGLWHIYEGVKKGPLGLVTQLGLHPFWGFFGNAVKVAYDYSPAGITGWVLTPKGREKFLWEARNGNFSRLWKGLIGIALFGMAAELRRKFYEEQGSQAAPGEEPWFEKGPRKPFELIGNQLPERIDFGIDVLDPAKLKAGEKWNELIIPGLGKVDVRITPLAPIFLAADMMERGRRGLGETTSKDIFGALGASTRGVDQSGDMIATAIRGIAESEEEAKMGRISGKALGAITAGFLTPLRQVSDLISTFDEKENVMRETGLGEGFGQQFKDQIKNYVPKWKQSLPERQWVTRDAPPFRSQGLEKQLTGIPFIEPKNWLESEMDTLGIKPRDVVPHTSDPRVNYVIDKLMGQYMEGVNDQLMWDDEFNQLPAEQRRQLLLDEIFPAFHKTIKDQALAAVPEEMIKEEIKKAFSKEQLNVEDRRRRRMGKAGLLEEEGQKLKTGFDWGQYQQITPPKSPIPPRPRLQVSPTP